MADNINLPLTGSGDTTRPVRGKDRAGVLTQIGALDLNPAGAETLMAGSMPVTKVDGADQTLGTTTDASTANTVIGRLQKLVALIAGGLPSSLGQKTKANSLAVTLPSDADTLNTAVQSVPAANRATDSVAAAQQTDAVMNGLTALTPKFAKIVASASGVTQVVAGVSSKKIRVLAWVLVCNAAVNVKWQSHTTPTDLTGLHYFGANGGASVPFSPIGHFETVAGEALDINLSGAVAVGGSLAYVEV